ncbi:YybH family protein [Sphingomonas quercus]|uniref:Nuclear transport factor 2 family protein n=1 Tax=Sphingomonas quercus TaxID=2842451 RepID=A0ABS6BGN8_9SPHN|nr:nuclear transport factor 2 family protein [Sphingomonas quercus]MBU3077465.1 nuclear transport factor 2 family protein [Sphingomonas quercus]
MQPDSEIAIRIARAAFNRALADGDTDAIAPLLGADVVLVAGTDSAVISGRKAQLLAWRREFATRDRTLYVRTPETIIISPAFPIAFEHGRWQGVAAANGGVQASGSYTAKWRQSASGSWVIEAELYLTLS